MDGVECHAHAEQLEGIGEKDGDGAWRGQSSAPKRRPVHTHQIWHQLRIGAGLFLARELALVAANALVRG